MRVWSDVSTVLLFAVCLLSAGLPAEGLPSVPLSSEGLPAVARCEAGLPAVAEGEGGATDVPVSSAGRVRPFYGRQSHPAGSLPASADREGVTVPCRANGSARSPCHGPAVVFLYRKNHG